MELTIATRKSKLALYQSEFIAELLRKNGATVKLEGFSTKGDVLLDSALYNLGGKGLFTKELENAILENKAHLAVHSLKDLPYLLPKNLRLAAVSKREESSDCLLSQNFKCIKSLKKEAVVGTTSLRRQMQLLALRPDLKLVTLRGNINSRIEKLKKGEFDAIVLAKAGIKRLNLEKEVNFVYEFSKDELVPASSQGALGIESRNDEKLIKFLSVLNDEEALIETSIEREFVAYFQAGCQAPMGINAEIINDEICVRAVLGLPDASCILKDKKIIKKADFKGFGEILAKEFVKKGAKELLEKAQKMLKV